MGQTFFSDEHIYLHLEGDMGTIGISKFAQEQLIEVVYVEIPNKGQLFKAGDEVGLVESAKAANEVYAPVGGEVTEVNTALEDNASPINESPEDHGWIAKIKLADVNETGNLMNAEAYQSFISSLE